MPDGVVQWFDPTSGRASIVRGGHVYAAASSDVEPAARHPGVHVHFDIRRDRGAERAVDVRRRAGTRVSHHQRRYGTLTGARRPDTKGPAPFARVHPERGRSLELHPLEVARAWVECLQTRDLDGALSLYASDAVLHADGEDHTGRTGLGSYLEGSPMFGIAHDPDIRGGDGTVVVRWGRDRAMSIELHARIEHGMIAEQWAGHTPPLGRTVEIEGARAPVETAVLTHGRVGDDDVDYAVQRIAAVLRHVDDPILFARLKLDHAGDPAQAKPAVAQFAVDINGELVRAHVAGHTMREAADLLQQHLRAKLEQRAQRTHHLRTRAAERQPGEWRHGDLPTSRPDYYDRPPEERELVRHKTFATDELTPDEAAFDMEQLDYDFHLFRDLASGEDAVLARAPDGSYRLTRLHPSSVEGGPAAVELTIDPMGAPELSVPDAIQRLDANGERFIFFASPATHRGNVVYRRYDGHYGLITPASS